MAVDELHHHLLKMLVIITDRSLDHKVKRILDELRIPAHYHMLGKGTAGSELLEICGLDGTTRSVTFFMIRDILTPSVFYALKKYAKFNEKGTGIAFTIPINGAQASLVKDMDEGIANKINEKIERSGEEVKNEASFNMIIITCRQGFSSNVMEVAKRAGATGGTVLKGRREGTGSTMRFLGITTQEEREIVSILAPKSIKSQIMKAVSSECGANTDAQSVVISLPVDEIIGLVSKKDAPNSEEHDPA